MSTDEIEDTPGLREQMRKIAELGDEWVYDQIADGVKVLFGIDGTDATMEIELPETLLTSTHVSPDALKVTRLSTVKDASTGSAKDSTIDADALLEVASCVIVVASTPRLALGLRLGNNATSVAT